MDEQLGRKSAANTVTAPSSQQTSHLYSTRHQTDLFRSEEAVIRCITQGGEVPTVELRLPIMHAIYITSFGFVFIIPLIVRPRQRTFLSTTKNIHTTKIKQRNLRDGSMTPLRSQHTSSLSSLSRPTEPTNRSININNNTLAIYEDPMLYALTTAVAEMLHRTTLTLRLDTEASDIWAVLLYQKQIRSFVRTHIDVVVSKGQGTVYI